MAKASDTPAPGTGERLAKAIARAGLCSRREAEKWISDGRVAVNGKPVRTPAFNISSEDLVEVDGNPLAQKQGTRVWLYHKPAGLVVTESDPEGRETIFESLEAQGLPRVLTVGRLDINTEGLLLLTNDGGLKRVLELPSTGWLRRYRVRAHGRVTQAQLDALRSGVEVEGVKYGPIEAEIERVQGGNAWITVALREGKNREIKNVLGALGLQVNRLIRTSYGPFQLGDLPIGAVKVIRARVLRDQLGQKLADEAGVDFDAPMPEAMQAEPNQVKNPNSRIGDSPRKKAVAKSIKPIKPRGKTGEPKAAPPNPRAKTSGVGRPPLRQGRPEPEKQTRRVIFDEDGRAPEEFVPSARRPRPDAEEDTGFARRKREEKPFAKKSFGDRPPRRDGDGDRGDFKPRGDRPGGDRPRRDGDGERRDFKPRGDRPFGNKPYGDRPRRDGDGDRGDFKPRGDRPGGDRPRRDGDGERRDFKPRGDKPFAKKSFGDRPPRRDGDGDRRDFKPRGDRPGGDRPRRDGDGDRRDFKPRGDKPFGKKPFGDRSGGGSDRPRGERSFDKPGGGRPGGRPGGGGGPRGAGGPRSGGAPRGGNGGPRSGGPRPPRKPRSE